MTSHGIVALALMLGAALADAQTAPPARFEGSLVQMQGAATLEVANDEVLAHFFVEVEDADPVRAQSRVNQQVADGVALLRRADSKARIDSRGYQSTPVHGRESAVDSARRIVGWRVRQTVTLQTAALDGLPRTVAAGQERMALGRLEFRLSGGARERSEAELIRGSIANLNSRVAAAAAALGVPAARVRIEELNFGVAAPGRPPIQPVLRSKLALASADKVEEPALEAGHSVLQATVNAKVRFLAP